MEQHLKEGGGGDTEGQAGFPCRRDSGGNMGGLFQNAHLHFICLYPLPSLHLFKQAEVSKPRQKCCLACKISWLLFSKKQPPETVPEGGSRREGAFSRLEGASLGCESWKIRGRPFRLAMPRKAIRP